METHETCRIELDTKHVLAASVIMMMLLYKHRQFLESSCHPYLVGSIVGLVTDGWDGECLAQGHGACNVWKDRVLITPLWVCHWATPAFSSVVITLHIIRHRNICVFYFNKSDVERTREIIKKKEKQVSLLDFHSFGFSWAQKASFSGILVVPFFHPGQTNPKSEEV